MYKRKRVEHGWMDGWIMDGGIDRWMMDKQVEGWTDR